MKGWTEEEIKNKELRAPCGIFCGACAIYIADRNNSSKFKSMIAALWRKKPEEIGCLGCMQSDPPRRLYGFCQECPIRECAKTKALYSCHQCDEWPCSMMNGEFGDRLPSSVKASVKRVMLRSIPSWRQKVAALGDEQGSEEWARAECERYHCPKCGEPLYRSAQQCHGCRTDVAEDLDGRI